MDLKQRSERESKREREGRDVCVLGISRCVMPYSNDLWHSVRPEHTLAWGKHCRRNVVRHTADCWFSPIFGCMCDASIRDTAAAPHSMLLLLLFYCVHYERKAQGREKKRKNGKRQRQAAAATVDDDGWFFSGINTYIHPSEKKI